MGWKKWIGFLISFVFLGLVILNNDPGELVGGILTGDPARIFNPQLHLSEMGDVFRDVQLLPLLVATALSVFLFVIRAVRWRFLLLPTAVIGFGSLFSATMIGFMANNVLPARIGEFVRAYVLSKKEPDISTSSALATLVVERLFDFFSLLLIFVVTLYLGHYPDWVRDIGIIATLVFFGFLLFLVVMVTFPAPVVRILTRLSRILPGTLHQRVERVLLSFIEGLDILKDRRLIIIVLALSIFHWMLLGWTMALGLSGFGIDLPASGPFFVTCLVCLGIAIPSSPGFVGTFQWFTVKGLSVYDISKNIGLPFSLGFHLILYVPTTVIGLFFFFKENLTWGEVREKSVPEDEAQDDHSRR